MNHLAPHTVRAALPAVPQPAELQLYEVAFSVNYLLRRDVYARDADEAVTLVRALMNQNDCTEDDFLITATANGDLTARLAFPAPAPHWEASSNDPAPSARLHQP